MDQKKIAFLTEVKSRLKLSNLIPLSCNWQTLPQAYDVVVSRAAGKLSQLLAVMERCTLPGRGLAVLHKGQSWRDELTVAQESWAFSCVSEPSLTNSESAILIIRDLAKRGEIAVSEGLKITSTGGA
jgi:16S rRNA (guanine527-N7)-methyltransferase